MDHENDQQAGQVCASPFWRSRYGLGLIVFGAVAAYFLLTEHRAHFFGALPFLLLLACPLMHVFMHRGHGQHGGEQGSNKPAASKVPNTGEQP